LNPEKQALLSEQEQVILRLLGELSEEQREVLVLRYLLNWKVRDIAIFLDYPANRVSVHIRRGLEKLKTLWPDEKEF
jgi:RNA polymerase sigma factor (sigma-70 family)